MSSAAVSHPLQNTWVFLCSSANEKNKQNWKNVNREITKIASVEDFWSFYEIMPKITETAAGNDFYFFKDFSAPSWEHPSNKEGGFWTADDTIHQDDNIQEAWLELLLRVLGNTHPHADIINGIQLSSRPKNILRIRIWTSTVDLVKKEALLDIGKDVRSILKSARKIEFKVNELELKGSKQSTILTSE